jgi:N-acyl-D-amino-acid deacylase
MHDVLIRGATICDGTGTPTFRADLAVANGRVAGIGRDLGAGRRTIDADGLVAAPGFIDVHTHYDCQLSWDPALTPSSWHGITTVVVGNCGFTIAPCRASDRELLMQMLLYVEGMPTSALRAGIRWEWETFPEYLDAVERSRPAINVAALIGHSAVRYWVMGGAAAEREANAGELEQMRQVVHEAILAGAFGFATSESPTHFFGDGTPVPSRVAPREETLALASVLKGFGRGIIEVAPRHLLGSTEDKSADQRFYSELAHTSGRPVTWAPLLHSPFDPDGCLQLIEEAAVLQREGIPVYPQVGCRPLEVRISFDTAGIAVANNPFWRPILGKPIRERQALFASKQFRDDLRQMSPKGAWVAALAPGWDQIFVRMSPLAVHQELVDNSVAAISERRQADPVDTLLDLALEADLACQFGIPIMNVDESRVGDLIRHPAGILALSDAGAHVDTLADQGFTSTLLGHWVRELGALSLPEAVRLVTTVPARVYGLEGRGELRLGSAADVVLFDPERIGLERTEMVHDLPGGAGRLIQRAIGVEYVLVNGEPLIEQTRQTEARSGGLLRSGG